MAFVFSKAEIKGNVTGEPRRRRLQEEQGRAEMKEGGEGKA